MSRVLIVDDHEALRRAVRDVLTTGLRDVEVHEAVTADEAVRRVEDETWDVVLLDLALGSKRGFDTLRRIKQARADLAVLVMSMHPEEQYGAAARAAGAAGYLTKGASPDTIVAAVRKAASLPAVIP
jgi:two-component system, NarL family, invasion response regulator UvrY